MVLQQPMDELELFFEAIKNGNENPVDLVRDALDRKKKGFDSLQEEAVLSEDECRRRLDRLFRLLKMCDKIDLINEEQA